MQHGGSPTDTPYPQDAWSAVYAKAAEAIIEQSGVTRGYCLVLGSEEGRLAYELAQRTDLEIFCVEEDPQKVATSRKALMEAGLYGSRISVGEADPSALPSYFANLVVSDSLLRSGRIPGDPQRIARHVKPIGGVICLGLPDSTAVEDPEEEAVIRVVGHHARLPLNNQSAADGHRRRSGHVPVDHRAGAGIAIP